MPDTTGSVRELIIELAGVEDAVRRARTAPATDTARRARLRELFAHEARTVAALRRH